ncbi:MAG TPA: hypothetical protein VHU89_18405 [Acidobacteriaceae bacterium]|jgi:DNA-binding response OmpR family regulator|nr:hypothetical protein [Acidobacteriaceae bacterium]
MLAAIQIGTDPVLLRTRGAVLETAGLRVVSVESFVRAMEKILTDSFDLAILCHSLPRTDRLNFTAAIRRRHPSALVLLVSGGRGASTGEEDGMDAVLEAEPRGLLRSLRDILRLRQKVGGAQLTEEACQA